MNLRIKVKHYEFASQGHCFELQVHFGQLSGLGVK